MTTTKSSSEKTRFLSIYKAALKGQIPFLIISGIVYALLLPLVYVVSFTNPTKYGIEKAAMKQYFLEGGYFRAGIYATEGYYAVIVVVLILFGLVMALIQNLYLHNKKMTDFYHSLPVKRKYLFGANAFASLTTILGPFFLFYLLTMGMQLIQYASVIPNLSAYFSYIAYDLLNALVVTVAVYLFASFVAVNVGTVFDTFAITGVLGVTPLLFVLISKYIWAMVTYGATVGRNYMVALSPFTFGFHRSFLTTDYYYWYYNDQPPQIEYGKLYPVLLIWAVLSAVLYAATTFCYARRKSEIAEQTTTGGVFHTIAKCMGAFIGGALFMAFFSNVSNMFVWLLCVIIGSVVVGTVGEVILSRGFRALRKNIKWLVGAGALCCVILLGSWYDVIGYTMRMPGPIDEIESVSITHHGRFGQLAGDYWWMKAVLTGEYSQQQSLTLTDPQTIAIIEQTHRLAVQDQPPRGYANDTVDYTEHWIHENQYPSRWIAIEYNMKNGKTIKRAYGSMNKEAAVHLNGLEEQPDFVQQSHPVFSDAMMGDIPSVAVYNSIGDEKQPYSPKPNEVQRLVDAVRQDMLAESLEQMSATGNPAVAYLEITYRVVRKNDMTNSSNCWVVVSDYYTNTLKVMEELGMLEKLEVPEQADTILICSAEYELGGPYQILISTPNSYNGIWEITEYDYESYLIIEDSTEVQSIQAAGRSQLMTGEREGDVYDTAYMRYLKDGINIGCAIIPVNQLPESVRHDFQKKFGYSATQNEPNEVTMEEEIAVEAVI